MNERALITGITGMVGSHLADYLIANTDWEIYGMCRWRSSLDNISQLIPRINAKDRVHGVEVINAAGSIASNQIDSNGAGGVLVSEVSSVFLGENTGTSIFRLPNSTSVANTGFGIQCQRIGQAFGRLGTLNGSSGAKSFGLTLTLTVVTTGSSDLTWGPVDEVDDASSPDTTPDATRFTASVSGSGASGRRRRLRSTKKAVGTILIPKET